jgi:predicted ATPase
MYLQKILLENVGPVDKLILEMPFTDEGNPKPVIIVGENGRGKSILLSFIVNVLISAKQVIYDDTEVEKGKVYKYRHPQYIRSGENYYFSKLFFESEFECTEWQLDRKRSDFENDLNYTSVHQDWEKTPLNDSSFFGNNFVNKKDELEKILSRNSILFFPPDRFEDPGWLNLDNLLSRPEFVDLKKISGYSNRSIISTHSLKIIKNWMLDVLYDSRHFEISTQQLNYPVNIDNQVVHIPIQSFHGFMGNSTNLYQEIINFLKIIFDEEEDLRFGVGPRSNRCIAVMKNEQVWIPDLFQLSTGEVTLFNIFCSILRDFDLTGQPLSKTQDIRGIVLIDEIDLHLHTKLQIKVLPKLINLFPKIQFIITTHSPLFLLGMQKELSEDGFKLIEMPNGKEISVECFKEFENAYYHFSETQKYQNDLDTAIRDSQKSIIFVEGEHDIQYINKTAELLGRKDILEKIDLKNGDGFGNLSKISKHFDSKLSEITPQKILLLYDCDIEKCDSNKGNIFQKTVPSNSSGLIQKGIENLLSNATIEKVRSDNKALIDFSSSFTRFERGQEKLESEKYGSISKLQKYINLARIRDCHIHRSYDTRR